MTHCLLEGKAMTSEGSLDRGQGNKEPKQERALTHGHAAEPREVLKENGQQPHIPHGGQEKETVERAMPKQEIFISFAL